MQQRKKIKLCINTQTPPVRFKLDFPELVEKYGAGEQNIDLNSLKEGVDYDFTPGGVTSMVYPALKNMRDRGYIENAQWVSLGPGSPSDVEISDNIILHNVWMEPESLALYANFKEGIWNEMHGLGRLQFKPREYEAYVGYNWKCAQIMLEMNEEVDLFWVHDFQQLHIGNLIGPSAPAVLRWHIPFNLDFASDRLKALILKSIEGFDAIVVSTKRDLQGLIRAGYRGRAYAVYPYLETNDWSSTNNNSENQMDNVRLKLGIGKNDNVLSVIARMDPVKSQDVAVRALRRLIARFPNIKLVLVGNGSFTGSSKGGIGHPKASLWHTYLEEKVKELKLEKNVIFAGHLNHEELDATYSISDVVLVPSMVEGFNLTGVEGWLHKKPCIVSRGAGLSELVQDEVNGFTFTPSDDADLSSKIERILLSANLGQSMGEIGSKTASLCSVDQAVDSLEQIFEEVIGTYSNLQ